VRDPLEHPEDAVRRVYAYVAYRIGPGPEAEDVTSTTIERAIKYRGTYRRAEGSPSAWLIGIARNCLADALTARSREAPIETELEPSIDDHAASSESRLDLHRAVAKLDQRARELIALRYGAGLRSKEIAAVLDIRPGAVDVAIHRALAELRSELEP
jgi:RNA polymerase sigma-70 factor, ECF subfamily